MPNMADMNEIEHAVAVNDPLSLAFKSRDDIRQFIDRPNLACGIVAGVRHAVDVKLRLCLCPASIINGSSKIRQDVRFSFGG
jgi:hypothetical protein